jgi:hypothetical protein
MTGNSNSAFGNGALQNLTSGSNNITIGDGAGSNLTTGSNNVYIGNPGITSESNIIRIGSTQTATFIAGTIMGNLNGNAATAANFSGNLAGEVTGTQNATVVSSAVVPNTANTIVRRDASGSFAAGTIALSGNLALPNTTSASAGVITLGGTPFSHNFGINNTFLGASAGNMSLTGTHNTAVGFSALNSNTTGLENAAFGDSALTNNTNGEANNAFGFQALFENRTGNGNSGFGDFTLASNLSGSFNAAFGSFALLALHSGDANIAIGLNAGNNLATGSNNIYIGSPGASSESNIIRIGQGQTATFIAGISGVNVSGAPVLVSSSGQLGVAVSSRRFKDDIADMADESDLLMKLRPVSFYYKPELDPTHTRQYGLVAEEVAQVSPELVVFDKDGVPQTVRYHFVNAMLLNEVQKQRQLVDEQRKANEDQQSTIARQQAEIQDLAARLAKLEALVSPAP